MRTSTVSKTTSTDLLILVFTSNTLRSMSDAERDQTMPSTLNAQSRKEKNGPVRCLSPKVPSTESFSTPASTPPTASLSRPGATPISTASSVSHKTVCHSMLTTTKRRPTIKFSTSSTTPQELPTLSRPDLLESTLP